MLMIILFLVDINYINFDKKIQNSLMVIRNQETWGIVFDSKRWYPSAIVGKYYSQFQIRFSCNLLYLTARKHKNQITKITTKALNRRSEQSSEASRK